jgi:hypothetical protein
MTYDDPNAVHRAELSIWTAAGAAAINGKFSRFQSTRLIAAHAVVDVAGTSAGNLVNVIHVSGTATTTRASLVLGTSTAGAKVDVVGIAATILPGDLVYCINGTDATGRAVVTLEMQQTPDAVRSPY